MSLKETFILIRTKLNSRNYEGKTAVVGTWVDNDMDAIVKVHIDIVHLVGDNESVYQVMHGMNNNIKSQPCSLDGRMTDYHGIVMYLQGSGRGLV